MEVAMSIDHILKRIFSHLPHQELRSIMPVCSTWDRIARSPSLWQHITLDWKDLPLLMAMSAGEQDASVFNRESLYSLLQLAGTKVESVSDFSTDEDGVQEVVSAVLNSTKNGKLTHIPKPFYEPWLFNKRFLKMGVQSISTQCFSLNELALFQHFSNITHLYIYFPIIETLGNSQKVEKSYLLLKERVYEELMTQVADKLSHLQSLKVAGVEMTSRALDTFRMRIMTRLYSFDLVLDDMKVNDILDEVKKNNQEKVTTFVIDLHHKFNSYYKAVLEWHGIREDGGMKQEYVVRLSEIIPYLLYDNVAGYFPNVESLALSGPVSNAQRLVTKVVPNFVSIQELKLSNFSGLSFTDFTLIFNKCPRLRKLELTSVHFGPLNILLNSVPRNLRELTFNKCGGVGTEQLGYLIQHGGGFTLHYTPLT